MQYGTVQNPFAHLTRQHLAQQMQLQVQSDFALSLRKSVSIWLSNDHRFYRNKGKYELSGSQKRWGVQQQILSYCNTTKKVGEALFENLHKCVL